MKKSVSVILLAILLSVTLSLSAFAVDGDQFFSLVSLYVKQGQSDSSSSWTKVNSCSFSSSGVLSYNAESVSALDYVFGLRGTLQCQALIKVEAGYYFSFYYTFSGATNMPPPEETYFTTYVTASDGTIYPLTSVIETVGLSYKITSSGKVGDGSPISFNQLTFETNLRMPVKTSVAFSSEIYSELTPEQQRNEALMESIQQNSQAIIDANNANTDKITNGWGTEDNSSSSVDSVTDDMQNAENEALGGKTDEQIKAEVDSVLSNDNIPQVDHTGVIGVAGLFDRSLAVFGQDYQSLLVLSLTLGFAAFLVGRQYRARGD